MAQRGRPPGSLNKSTAAVKELAQKHGPAAIERLAVLAATAESEQAQVAACREILDRAYGKAAPSPEEREDTKSLIVQIVKFRNG